MNKEGSVLFLPKIDFALVFSVLALMVIGIAFIYSSGITSDGRQISREWLRQILWAVSGITLMIGMAFIDYRQWKPLSIILYIGLIVALLLVLISGKYTKGARSWMGIGGIGIQPSEFGKLILIITLSRWFDKRERASLEVHQLLGALAITGIPTILILLQPDLGTAIVYLPIVATIAYFAGIRWNLLLFPLAIGILVIGAVLGFAWSEYIAEVPSPFFRLFTEKSVIKAAIIAIALLNGLALLGWFIFHRRYFLVLLYICCILGLAYSGTIGAIKMLHGYQMMRLVVFFNPQVDPRGAGWHIIQSVTAVGSGGLEGKGFLQGTQSHYQYLPEQSTDFIFSIISEEMGFIGGLLIFVLFAIIIFRSLYIAYNASDLFGTYIAVGIAAMVAFHVIQNIGMVIGVMPITGIPLFYLSYGGSSLWTALVSMGILLSINYRR